jgi:hypothetical protein
LTAFSWFTFNDVVSPDREPRGKLRVCGHDHRSFQSNIQRGRGSPCPREGTDDTTNVDFQIEIVPADGIRLPFLLEAETSERRRFLGST